KRGVHWFRFQGREFLHRGQSDDAWIRWRRRQCGLAQLYFRLGARGGFGCGAFDGAGQSHRHRAIQRQTYARLLGLLSNTPLSQSALMFYVITYAVTTVGAFGVVFVVEEATGGDAINNFKGLSRRAPGLSLCLLAFLL